MKKLIFFFLFAVMAHHAVAQVRYESGYIITTAGEKLNCLVKNMDWKYTPESIEYKVSENTPVLTATVYTAKEVHVGIYTFKNYTVNIDRSPEKIASLTTDSTPVVSREALFLRVLVEGDIDLLMYSDKEYSRYFYLQHNAYTEPQGLVYKMYKGEDNKILYNKTYKSTLQKLFKDRVSNYDLFKKLEYNDRDLTQLFRMYNRVTDIPVEETTVSSTSKIHLKAGISARSASLSAGYSTSNTSGVDFGKKTIPSFGAELEWVLPNNRNKWGIFFAPYYLSYSNKAEKTVGTGASSVQHLYNAKYAAVEAHLGIRYYMYVNNENKFFLNGGYVFSKSLSNSYLRYTRMLDGSATLTAQSLSNQQSSIFAGTGYSYKNFSAEIRYHNNRAIHGSYAYWQSKYSDISLILQYSIL